MRSPVKVSWYQLNAEDVFARLGTGRDGLSHQEAARRLDEHGPNRLAADEVALPVTILLRQIRSPLIYVLIGAAIVTVLLGKYVDTGVILAVVVLNSVVGFIQEYKAEQALRVLAQLVSLHARVLRGGEELEIDASEVVPGDVVLLESGTKVPCDLRLFRVLDLQTDESILTGESLPVVKKTDPIPILDAPLGDQTDMAFMGTIIVRGRGAGVAVATGMSTVFGEISAQVRRAGETRSPLQVRLDQFARLIALVVLGVTAIVFVLGLTTGESLADVFLTAVATAVAAVPEGLPVTITVALAVGVWRIAQQKAIIRKLPAIETLGSCTVIASDKTGTLTRNEMTVTKIWAGGRTYNLTGAGYVPKGEILHESHSIQLSDHPALELALRIGLLANESDVYEEPDGSYRVDGDPTEAALIVAAEKAGLHRERELAAYRTLDEIPFESDRQYMATLLAADDTKVLFIKGAPERIIEMCEMLLLGEGVPLDRAVALGEAHKMAATGLRVLAMAFRTVPSETEVADHQQVEHGLVLVGLEGMIDPPRPEAIEAVAACKRAGIRPVMITGDHRITAEAIARQIGVSEKLPSAVLDGRQLEAMSDEELFGKVEEVSVYARSSPQHKLRIVRQLRRHGEVVAVTGDGVNDAPALKEADIGVAMGIGGTDVAREASDMVLADDNFATIYAAVEQGRVVFDNVRKVIMFLIPTGLGLVLTIIASIGLRLPLPFLPAQAIWINLVTNGLQDVAMAFEPPEGDIGRRAPRNPREGVMTRLMIERTVTVGLVLMIGTLVIFVWQLNSGASIDHARTVAVTTMVLFQNFHIFNSRSFTKSAFVINPLSNLFLFATIVGALGLHILAMYWAPLQLVLRFEPLPLETWLTLTAVAASVLVVVEIEKAIRHRLRAASKRSV
ncbi:MAG: HAD family hydrolase [Chloroflexota bacterium]|nr:MAG: HAD family hydrolase [Chloroflexota bacterium]